jgi:hypothetical protein
MVSRADQRREFGARVASMDGSKGGVPGLADALQIGFKCLHGFGEALAAADLGDDRADDVKDLGGILVESVGTVMVVGLLKRPEDFEGERR